MSAKPKQNPEKLLKGYARKRRDDAASLKVMPDSMRDTLHAQVERTYSGDSKGVFLLHMIRQFWPRLAFGGAVCLFAVLGAILWQFQNADPIKRTEFAIRDTSEPSTLVFTDKEGAVTFTVAESLNKKTEAPSQQTQPMQMDAESDSTLASFNFQRPSEPERAPSASPRLKPVPAPLASSAIRSSQVKTPSLGGPASTNQRMAPEVAQAGSADIRLYYTQIDRNVRLRRNFNSPPYPDILQSFEARIQGTNLSVIDADGSIYEGSFRVEDASAADSSSIPMTLHSAERSPITQTRGGSSESAALLNRSIAQKSTTGLQLEFNFRVVGSNRSLNRQVVFTGNMKSGRLEGKASIGGTNQFKVEAIPVSK